jgi:3-deoxy-7-phosphoheptulonate synthase
MNDKNIIRLNWQARPAAQQPQWPNQDELVNSINTLKQLPALVFAGETRNLKQDLVDVENGDAFILQCGDCAEKFAKCHGPSIHKLLKVILQMSAILSYAGDKRIILIGRIAGQYAKPRTSDTEIVNGKEIPCYRGDMVNAFEPTLTGRIPDPKRIIEGYFRAAATLNLIRAFTMGGYAAWEFSQDWHDGFNFDAEIEKKYLNLINGIRKSFKFIKTLGCNFNNSIFNQTMLYTSHEALLLDYEDAMTRIDTTSGAWYNTGAHMIWLGDRTRQLHGAHVAYASGISNPIGIKIGPNYDVDELKQVINMINPNNEAGKIVLITRMGSKKIDSLLPRLLREMQHEGFRLTWSCDPMHGNTYVNNQNIKTRDFAEIINELKTFFEIHKAEGTVAGGIHLEITEDDVTECIGGSIRVEDAHLQLNYQSNCDPRLNASQALEAAFEIANLIKRE